MQRARWLTEVVTLAPDPRERAAEVRLRDGIPYAVAVFVALWVGWAILCLLGVGLFQPGNPLGVPGLDAAPITPGWHNLINAGNHTDALWYERIGTAGYRTDDSSAAFFPLYPIAIFLLSWLGTATAATVVAQGCALAALIVLYALTAREFGVEVARRAVVLQAIFPTAFFLLIPYTEAPFLLLALLTFWYARGNKWAAAMLVAALAGLTRSVGVVLVPALVIEAIWQYRQGARLLPRLVAACGPGLGLGLYLAYWGVHGDWLAPVHAESTWQRQPTAPWLTLWHSAWQAWQFQSYWLIDALIVFLVIAALIVGVRLLPPSYLTYGIASLLVPLCNPWPSRPLMSMPRFVLLIFPAIWVIAVAVHRRRLPSSLVTACFAGGYTLCGVLFINAYGIF